MQDREYIIVTARKLLEAEHRLPLSVQAVTAEQTEREVVANWRDLADAVPGLVVAPSARGTPMPALRGVGFNNPALSASSPVAVYQDEGHLPFPAMNGGPMLDLAHVEVLKGPQGTLFGRNATGGLIHYVTRKPGDGRGESGFVRLKGGSWQRYGLELASDLPVTDLLAFRVAAMAERSDKGWQRRRSGPERLGRDRLGAVRLSGRWRYSDAGTLLAIVNWWQDKSDTQVPQSVGLYPRAMLGQAVPEAGWADFATQIGLPSAFVQQRFDRRAAPFADWATSPLPWGGTSFTPPPDDLRKDNHFRSVLLRADQGIGSDMMLTAVVHHARLDRREVNDASGWNIENALIRSKGRTETSSQELRLSGRMGELPWIIGVAHMRDKVRDVDDAWVGTSSTLQLLRAQMSGLAALGGADAGMQTEIFYGGRAARNRMTQRSDSVAIFGEADWPVAPQWTLTTGLRFTRDRTRFSGCSADLGDGNLAALLNPFYNALAIPASVAPGGCVTFQGDLAASLLSGGAVPFPAQGLVRDRLSEQSVTGRLALRWTPADDRMLYLSLARGTKAGSFPNLEANLASQYSPAKQERLIALEAGAKMRWGERLSFAGSLFYYDYRDKQVFGAVEDLLFATLSRIVNVPRSHAYGAEGRFRWSIASGWQWDANAAWLRTRIDKYVGYDDFGAIRSFAGGIFPYAPELDLRSTLSRQFSLPKGRSATLFATYRHASASFADMLRDPAFRIPGHDQIDLGLTLRFVRPTVTLRIVAENVTNQSRWTNAYLVNDSLTRYADRPQHVTATLTSSW